MNTGDWIGVIIIVNVMVLSFGCMLAYHFGWLKGHAVAHHYFNGKANERFANELLERARERLYQKRVFLVGDYVAYDVNSHGVLVDLRGDRCTVRHPNGGEVMIDTAELRHACTS